MLVFRTMEMKEESKPCKIIRACKETLMVKVSPTEIGYRHKYLPGNEIK